MFESMIETMAKEGPECWQWWGAGLVGAGLTFMSERLSDWDDSSSNIESLILCCLVAIHLGPLGAITGIILFVGSSIALIVKAINYALNKSIKYLKE